MKQWMLIKSWYLCLGVELELLVHRGSVPKQAVTLSSKKARLDIQWETAAGDLSLYPGNDHAYNQYI